tara:strand:- start:200 stop:460 length:261 start_codon:yes stop_codon:yes gene_type:complete
MKYAIMVTVADETFIDGHYSNEDDAKEVFKRWEQTYPQLKFDFCATLGHVWPISDEVFMPNNRDVLKIVNALAEITNNDAYKKSLH